MSTTLLDDHRRLAREFHERQPGSDAQANWFEAQRLMVQTFAYYRRQRLNGVMDDVSNWEIADKVLQWRERLEEELQDCLIPGIRRPYLALAAGHRLAHLGRMLQEKCPLGAPIPTTGASTAAFALVLDGAPEYARQQLSQSAGDNSAWTHVADKDALFFEHCRQVLGLHNARMVEGVLLDCHKVDVEDRAFEDGCLGIFAGESFKCDLVAAVLQLRRYLHALTYKGQRPWNEELHPRVAVGTTWEMVLRGLTQARRDDIVVEDVLLASLEPCVTQILLADGIRLSSARIKPAEW